jgi:AcrR family transcriptional regulator
MSDTQKKILDAAERLFANKGIDAVSLREINAAAGVSPSVLHYHFGGRDALINALLERRFPVLGAARAAMLDRPERAGHVVTARELIEVILLPLAQMALDQGKAGQRFVKVLAKLHLERNKVYEAVSMKYTPSSRLDIVEQLVRQYPDYPPEAMEARMAMALNAMFSTLAGLEHAPRTWQPRLAAKPLAPQQLVDILLDFMCAGLRCAQ